MPESQDKEQADAAGFSLLSRLEQRYGSYAFGLMMTLVMQEMLVKPQLEYHKQQEALMSQRYDRLVTAVESLKELLQEGKRQ